MLKNDDIFLEKYNKLNQSQRAAVDMIEGPVMVVAGPGTGKTTILTLRIANILRKTDVGPSAILALTFTESGVKAMRRKLLEIIGGEAHKVGIHTFHSFCNEVIKDYPDDFPYIIGSSNATDVDRVKIIETILEKNNFEYIKPYGDNYYYVYPILSHIQNVKREGFTPEKFKELLDKKKNDFLSIEDLYHEKGKYKGEMKGVYKAKEKLMKRDEEFLKVYELYQSTLREKKMIDFEDMIIEVVRSLEDNNELLLMLQEKYQYILADEHQDANNAQNKILELLSNFHSRPNIFVVGDEKQAIFRFQGASLENFLYFQRLYGDTELVQLEDNYRSTQHILDNALSLIKNNKTSQNLHVVLKSNTSYRDRPIKVHSFPKVYDEINFIINDIKRKIDTGVSPEEIAIIYRNNKDSFELARILEKTDIPFVIFSDQDILEHVDIRRFITLLRAVSNISNDVYLTEAMHISYFNIHPMDVYTVLDFARASKKKILDVLLNDVEKLKIQDINALQSFVSFVEEIGRKSKTTDVLTLAEEVLNKSGYLQNIISNPVPYERLAVLDTFFNEMRKVTANHSHFLVDEFLEHLDVVKKYKISVRNKGTVNRNGIRLMTAHRSKGLEFENVYIYDAVQKKWGASNSRNLFSPILDFEEDGCEDERRLFYVALTRAKYNVVITYANSREDDTETLPTQFLDELHQDMVSYTDGEEVPLVDVYNGIIDEKPKPTLHDKEYLNKRFLEQPFSVTALNNYLKCPWTYFYTNLIRLPKTYSKQQTYGTIVHDVLQEFYESFKEVPMTKDAFMKRFYYHLDRQLLDEMTHDELRKKGENTLGGYFDFYFEDIKVPLETEYKVFGECKIDEKNTLTLTGKLDKIDDAGEGKVNVVDYKTSKIKTRNDILGKTKNSDGSIFRQLAYYALLLRTGDTPYKMQGGVIDFVEPDEKGNYKKEKFEVTHDDVEELIATIQKVAMEILNLEFWDKRCDDAECQYCKLRENQVAK